MLNMDHASHAQPTSQPPLPHNGHSSADSSSRLSPKHNDTSSPFSPDVRPTRQQQLLQNRNTRFPAKKLSISGISNKLTQLISNNEYAAETNTRYRDQENYSLHSRNTSTLGRRSGLSVLEEISNTARSRSVHRRADIQIYQDTPEGPLLQSSPYAISSPDLCTKHDFTSPLDLGRLPDSLDEMHMKTLSPSERWSTLASSPPESRSHLRKRSGLPSYDQEEYIKHLEERLHQLEQDAYSPLTRRPMKEKLIAANKENERLYKELAMLKEKFETEVKRTVEHKTATEVELRKRVRDLEGTLEEKEVRIQELQYQHTENRLDANTVETLKSTIERLEQDKLNMEQIHQSMSKRNETLTKLVASGMSPPKTGRLFDKTSPDREKGNSRMSLILPKVPSSPSGFQRYSYSATASPVFLSSSDISPLKLSSNEDTSCCLEDLDKSYFGPRSNASTSNEGSSCSPALSRPVSRRSTMHAETSMSMGTRNSVNISASHEPRIQAKRKARKFLAGSTQLKPLLLPALTSEPVSLASTPSMPFSGVPQFEAAFESSIEQDADLTITVDQLYESLDPDVASDSQEHCSLVEEDKINGDPGPAYSLVNDELPNMEQESPTNSIQTLLDLNAPNAEMFSSDTLESVSEQSMSGGDVSGLECLESQFWSNSPKSDPENDSIRKVLISNTANDMAVVPLPLFSPVHLHDVDSNMPSRTPSESSQSPVKVYKKRQFLIKEAEGFPLADQLHPDIAKLPSPIPDSMPSNRRGLRNHPTDRQVSRMKLGDNFVGFLRKKNFAAKPLTMVTIRTVYRMLSACTRVVQDFRKDPFALARRVLANAWHMNWKALGKLSWWVLGLFIHPETQPRTRPAIDWEQYDGESIADRYCNHEGKMLRSAEALAAEQEHGSTEARSSLDDEQLYEPEASIRPGLLRSLFLWGKFSAAIMLAVGGAIIKGPNEMMKNPALQDDNSVGEEQISTHSDRARGNQCNKPRQYETPQRAQNLASARKCNEQSTNFRVEARFSTQLDAISPLNWHCEAEQRRSDLNVIDCENDSDSDAGNDPFSPDEYRSNLVLDQCVDQEFEVRATASKGLDLGKRFETTTKPFLLFDELSESSYAL